VKGPSTGRLSHRVAKPGKNQGAAPHLARVSVPHLARGRIPTQPARETVRTQRVGSVSRVRMHFVNTQMHTTVKFQNVTRPCPKPVISKAVISKAVISKPVSSKRVSSEAVRRR